VLALEQKGGVMARRRRSEAIVLDFLRSIGEGTLSVGSPLPAESILCQRYGVGRGVVREALQALDAKGFVVVRQGSVAKVARRQHWNVLDSDFLHVHSGTEFFPQLQTAREVLEPQIARLAATNATDAAIAAMVEANARLEGDVKNPADHAVHDIAFHRAIAQACDNSILASFHDSLTSLGERARLASAAIPGAIGRAISWHGEIIDAIRSRDPDGAWAAMTMHLRQVRAELVRLDDLHKDGASAPPSDRAEKG
jgi:DNA-binding FadR family transcriptional regulator